MTAANHQSDVAVAAVQRKPPLHVVLRYSDRLHGLHAVVAEHKSVLDRHGTVWWGKLGSALGAERVSAFNAQIDAEIETFLYLAQIKSGTIELSRGRLRTVSYSPNADRAAIPRLYARKKLMPQVGVWLLVDELIARDSNELDSLRIASTGSPASQALRSSMSGMFVVRR